MRVSAGSRESGLRRERNVSTSLPPTLSWWMGWQRDRPSQLKCLPSSQGSPGICITGTLGPANRKTSTRGNEVNRVSRRGFEIHTHMNERNEEDKEAKGKNNIHKLKPPRYFV